MNIYQTILKKRTNGDGFSSIRKELITSKIFEENEVNRAIGIIHDHELETLKTKQELNKGRSFFIGGLIIFVLSSGYTLFTYFSETLSYYVFLYGPILASLVGTAIGLEKYRSAQNHLKILENKFNIKA